MNITIMNKSKPEISKILNNLLVDYKKKKIQLEHISKVTNSIIVKFYYQYKDKLPNDINYKLFINAIDDNINWNANNFKSIFFPNEILNDLDIKFNKFLEDQKHIKKNVEKIILEFLEQNSKYINIVIKKHLKNVINLIFAIDVAARQNKN